MDVNFLKNISEAYIIDNELEISPDKIFEEMYDIVTFLREYDNELYESLYNSTKLNQQQVLKTYIDFSDEAIYEGMISTGVSILTMIVAALFKSSILRTVFKGLSKVGEYFEKFGNSVAKFGKYSQLRYSTIYKNYSTCYARCGIKTTKDIKFTSYFNIKDKILSGEQGRCLRNCYLDYLIETIALGMENYFACLKRTTGLESLKNSDADDILKLVSKTNLAASCESFYLHAKEALDNFYSLLDMIYDPHVEADKRLEKINSLRSKVYNARQTIIRADQKQIQRYDSKPQFNTSFRRN
ncbi:MAG: hypothetical protein WC188_03060 [Candidatus Caldatribacteriota bacterium]